MRSQEEIDDERISDTFVFRITATLAFCTLLFASAPLVATLLVTAMRLLGLV